MRYVISMLVLFFSAGIYSQTDVERLIETMLGETPIEENLQELCDQLGGRITGSRSNTKAVNWAYKKLTDAGVKTWKDPFEVPMLWLPGMVEASVYGMESFSPLIVTKYGVPRGEYISRIVDLGMGTQEEFELKKSEIEGKFILVHTELCLDINGLFAEYAQAAAVERLADEYGAGGIIFMSSRPKKLLYRFITSRGVDPTIPQFVMAREDAKRINRLIDNGQHIEVTIRVDAQSGNSFTSQNVIAEIPGSEKPEEVIIIGAHIDSWAMGTGANDNGCNVSMMIDIARQMTKLGIQPKRTIRFALWNGEEQGYFGSWDYTREHLDALDKHLMALSIDIGSGGIIGFFTNGREELVRIVDNVLAPVDSLGPFSQINMPIVGTDNFDFMLQGVPNLVGNHKPYNYGLNYHAASDTYDKVDLVSLKKNSAIVAALTLGFANLDEEKA
ncbi:MAG: M20/M25/M40 family metallo-hydrolase, partial [Bacteroidia bacterium]|nr:M20/M25/M40 family metallo-hydrolase [Bacteroidia bacterium]